MPLATVRLNSLDIDAIAASFQAHIMHETADPARRAASLVELATTWWVAVAELDTVTDLEPAACAQGFAPHRLG